MPICCWSFETIKIKSMMRRWENDVTNCPLRNRVFVLAGFTWLRIGTCDELL
jgi:hypothetical protein